MHQLSHIFITGRTYLFGMRGEKLSDAILYDKLNLLRKDFFGYIERNTEKVDGNLPVFYGYVISALESSFPGLGDDAYDEFIDQITYHVLDASRQLLDPEYIRRVMASALRTKKRRDAHVGIDIVIGLRLVKAGDCIHALDYLKKYATMDAKLGMSVAYCYYSLSLHDFEGRESPALYQRPGEMELLAREELLTLASVKPPVNRLKQLEVEDSVFLEKLFWQMVFLGLEWFPSEKWFLTTGLKNAELNDNSAMRDRLLEIGAERFYNDKSVLREMFYNKLRNRDAGGAAGIVNQLLKQFPDDLEPVYLGLKLSLLTSKNITYHSFRKLAGKKGMPAPILGLFDIAFDLLSHEKKDALLRLGEFEREYPDLRYYSGTIRYIAHDFFANDDMRAKRAKKTLLDSVEQYSLVELSKIETKGGAAPTD